MMTVMRLFLSIPNIRTVPKTKTDGAAAAGMYAMPMPCETGAIQCRSIRILYKVDGLVFGHYQHHHYYSTDRPGLEGDAVPY